MVNNNFIMYCIMFYMSLSICPSKTQTSVILYYKENVFSIKSYSLYFSILHFTFLSKNSLFKVLENSLCYASINIDSLVSWIWAKLGRIGHSPLSFECDFLQGCFFWTNSFCIDICRNVGAFSCRWIKID